MPNAKRETSKFLNVDLDIYSKSDLAPLVRAWGRKVIVLYAGREKELFSAHLELSSAPANAERAIRDLVRLIRRLPPPARKLWNASVRRSFNIGIQSGEVPGSFELPIPAGVLRMISLVHADVVVTVYSGLKRRPSTGRNQAVTP